MTEFNKKFFEDTRQKAEELKQKHLEDTFEPILYQSFCELVESLPKRRIELRFGMGTWGLYITSKAKYRSAFFDCLGGLNDYQDLVDSGHAKRFSEMKLVKFLRVLDEMVDDQGQALCLRELKYEPIGGIVVGT